MNRAQGGPQPRAGGGCVGIPEAIALSEALGSLSGQLDEKQKEEFQPRLKSLQQLMKQYERASGPSITETVRQQILSSVKTDDVREIVRPILRDLFDGRQGQGQDEQILDCILDALTDDLPLTTLIPMVCRMYIKAFYNDSSLRMALGAAFVGSSSYVAWVGGMNQIFGLGREAVIIILSAMAQCAHIVNDRELYLQTLNSLIGADLVSQIGTAIGYLLPSAGGIFAMSTLCLMNWIYGPKHFKAGDDLRQAAAAGGGPAQQQLPTGVFPAAAPAAAPAAVPAAANHVFRQMYDELKGAAVSVGANAKNHLVRILELLRRMQTTRPGQLSEDEQKWSTIANVYATACVNNVFDVFKQQVGVAGLSAVDVSAKHLLNACLPSEIRSGDELAAREEIFLLAHRIKSIVIDCVVAKSSQMREAAVSLLEEAFPVFSSGLTEANVDRFTAGQLSTILRMLLKAANDHEFSVVSASDSDSGVMLDDSQQTQPPQTPIRVRLASINDDLMKKLHLDQSVPRSPDEETELKEWVRTNIGLVGRVIGIFDVSIGWVAQQARKSKLLQCGVQAVSLVKEELRDKLDPGVAAKQARIFYEFPKLRQNLPAIDLFLTAPWIHVLNEIKTKQAQGDTYDKIIKDLCKQYRIVDHSEFEAYIKALLLRVDLEYIITRGGDCSVQPNIVDFTNKSDGTTYKAPVLTLSLPQGFYVNPHGEVERSIDLKLEVLEHPVHLPRMASETIKTLDANVKAAKNKSNELIKAITSVCYENVPSLNFSFDKFLTIPYTDNKNSGMGDRSNQQPHEREVNEHISACCVQAPTILRQLLEAQEVEGTLAAIQDVIDPDSIREAADNALLNGSRERDPSGGGKSRTRRRRSATAKRTRRKAYNKKYNKRKSRKQLSRRRQSRRK